MLATLLVMLAVPIGYADDKSGSVAATVNGESIALTNLDAELPAAPKSGPPLTASAIRSLRLVVVDALIEDVLLRQFLKKQNLTAEAKEIDDQFRVMNETLAKRGETLAKMLKDSGQTESHMRNQFALEIGFEKLVAKIGTAEELKKFHAMHRDFFDRVEIKANVRLVRVSKDAIPAERTAAAAKAKRGEGEKYLPVTNADGSVTLTKFDSGVEDAISFAAFTLAPGETSEPIPIEFGFATVTCLERTAPKPRPYDDLIDWIRDTYAAQLRKAVVAKLRKEATIQISIP